MDLLVAGFLALFLELAFIRWVPANAFALTYFSNAVLITSFLGLGIGFLLADKRKDLFRLFPLVLLGSVAAIFLFRFVYVFAVPPSGDILWNFFYVDNWLQPLSIHLPFLPVLVAVFLLSAAPFVFIGQKTAWLMKGMDPLNAYGRNILGGVAGIVIFSLLSFFGGNFGTPAVWFSLAGAASLWLLRSQKRWLIIGGVCVVAMGGGLFFSSHENWSPYYAVNVVTNSETKESDVYLNRFLDQATLDFVSSDVARAQYARAYALVKPERVLVLGAGTGNDVAIAEQEGAQSIDAVELDPVIAKVGKEVRLDGAYQDPRMHLTIGDARTFLKNSTDTYDMIVFGALDSHALLSGFSTVRDENFSYTLEALQEAKARLSPNGVLVLTFSAPQQWLGDKLVDLVAAGFDGQKPLVYVNPDDNFLFNLMIVAGPGLSKVSSSTYTAAGFTQATPSPADQTLPTDDWPYVYLKSRGIPSHYLDAIGLLLLIAIAGILLVSGKNVRQWGSWSNLNFFCLGAAFLLLETKGVTTLALTFGSTWIVNAVVLGSILVMMFLANLVVSKMEIKKAWPLYALLGVSLLLNFFLSTSVILTVVPFFFASLIFSFHAKTVGRFDVMLGVNVLGAVFGGFLEYASMLTGLRFLFVIAGALYLVAFLADYVSHPVDRHPGV